MAIKKSMARKFLFLLPCFCHHSTANHSDFFNTHRRYPSDEELDVGYNGYANLSLNGPALHIAYYDLNQALLLTEDWHIDIESGALEGPSLKKVLDDPSLHCRDT